MLAIFLVVLLCSPMANANPLKIWGLKGGYTAARQIWKHDTISQDDISWRSAMHLGAYVEWFDYEFYASPHWSHHLSVTTGLNYEQKGLGYTVTNRRDEYNRPLEDVTIYSRMDYLSIPIMAKYCVRGKRSAPYVLGGPRFDVLLDSEPMFGAEDEYGDVVFGLSAGAGFEVSQLGLFFEFVYNYDQSWLWKSIYAPTGNDIRVKNESFNISIGYGMKL